jgi:internalin A
MPNLDMTYEEQIAYGKALKRIEASHNAPGITLDLKGLRLKRLPPEIGYLTNLTELDLTQNQLSTLPPEICKLTILTNLLLGDNQLHALPPEVGLLTNLETLSIWDNQLHSVPAPIFKLVKLRLLSLSRNHINVLPPEIGKLTDLKEFYFTDNQLTTLPPEIRHLTKLTKLKLRGNPLKEPPRSIWHQGIEAIRLYFNDRAASGPETLWSSKLMLVGQGRVGKTELRHRLMNRPHGQAVSTEVVEIETVSLPHPKKQGVTMELRCWDFGGQDVYHATHQFFLTGRSLFVFCFEAGKDWEAGKPYYWLDKIAAVAPDAPVLVVATKGDERPAPSLPWEDLKKRYPQLIGNGCFTITTREKNRKVQPGDGISELLDALQAVAADQKKLPLMGESLPKAWIAGMNAVAKHPHDHYLKHEVFCQLLRGAGVPEESLHTVAMMLRDLGEILYYSEERDTALQDWVIIKPTWVTHAAARIMDSMEVQKNGGVLTQKEMSQAWREYPEQMHPVLLDLLEKYDLTYKIPDDAAERSLVVEKLPKDEAVAPAEWETLKPVVGGPNHEMRMTFRLASMQAGIPTWFIARKHYYTLRKHWLYGVYFADDRKARRHLALVRSSTDPKKPEVELTVRGPFPQTFFAVMKEGLEASIRDRYPRLIEKQMIPCCCLDKKPEAAPCSYAFDYQRLLERLQKGKTTAECDVTQEDVSVAELLFGYDAPAESTFKKLEEMEERIVDKVQNVGDKIDDLAALARQSFQYLYNDLQQREETHCPNLFVIWKAKEGMPFHVPMRLALVCQHQGQEHIACMAAQAYKIDALKEGLRRAAPLLKNVGTVLKYAKLTGLSALKEWDKVIGESIGNFQETLNEMLEDFEKIADKGEAPKLLAADVDGGPGELQEKRVAGAALREFRALLDKVDPAHSWHGLEKKRSNQTGEYLWVCKEHAAYPEYKR